MPKRDILLFMQLPQLDTDVRGHHENLYLAAACLTHAVQRAPAGGRVEAVRLPPALDAADDGQLVDHIAALAPASIAATLYLWNVERTLRLLRLVRRRLPAVRIAAGGPETARAHPFLFRAGVADAIAVGEGETVLPDILHAFEHGTSTDWTTVAWRHGRRYAWGRACPREADLATDLPPPDCAGLAPDVNGVAYVETTRGCPMRCAYCRYHHLRQRLSALPPEAVVARVTALRRLGAKEIRFVDPTFNAAPSFPDTLRALARANSDRGLSFFAELRADRIDAPLAALARRAGIAEVEAGVQSADPAVLAAIGRPTDPARIREGIRLLAAEGIRVTLDLMYGLPRQTLDSFRRSLDWALAIPGDINIQCLQTLLLPGTDLRDARTRRAFRAGPRPPYAVSATRWMSAADIAAVEDILAGHPRLASDTPTARFIGRSLPDLFPGRVTVPVTPAGPILLPALAGARRCVVFRGDALFERRAALAATIDRAVRSEPHLLWQFVLAPAREEPLDLLDHLGGTIADLPDHVLDRTAAIAGRDLRTAIRLFVELRRGTRYDPGWVRAADRLLRARFF